MADITELDAFWKVPDRAPSELHVPIAIQCVAVEPGEFIRYGMDVAIHAIWLAYLWATQDAIVGAVLGETVDDATIKKAKSWSDAS